MNFHKTFGLGGVLPQERSAARRLGTIVERLRLLLIILLALQWHFELEGRLLLSQSHLINIIVWLFFVAETSALTFLVERKRRYLVSNWGNFVIIICGLPFIWSATPITDVLFKLHYFPSFDVLGILRFCLIIWLLMPWIDVCLRNLSDNKLSTTLITAFIIMVMAGLLMSGIDPSIKSPLDGIWWAWVTASTVGYGDIVPSSWLGRLFASLLILMGLAMFAVLTANFSAFFIGRGVKESVEEIKKEGEDIRTILHNIKEVRKEETDILHLIREVDKRLQRVEKQLKQLK